jgi:hypothetical protein
VVGHRHLVVFLWSVAFGLALSLAARLLI